MRGLRTFSQFSSKQNEARRSFSLRSPNWLLQQPKSSKNLMGVAVVCALGGLALYQFAKDSTSSHRNFRTSASVDTQRYLEGYPGETDDKSKRKNLDFYSNRIPCEPQGDFIDGIHKNWFGNYHLLEVHHGYIQWLFPIRENGVNPLAQKLQRHEISAMVATPEIMNRLVKSYELMLDFYGMKLVDKSTGEVARSSNYRSRYNHLNSSTHNYLRITRILKCLGELGMEKYKLPFLKHVVTEIYLNGELGNLAHSCSNYWIPVLKNEDERLQIQQMVEKLRQQH